MRLQLAGEIFFITLLPAALFFLYDISIVNPAGFIDAYVYVGYINNFGDLFQRYGLTYYSVRFGLIGPALLLNKFLGPIAGYFAFCYALVLLAGVPLYAVFRKHFSVYAAIFAYSVLVSSVWFARHVLGTYTDAAAVPYLLAGVALVLLDPQSRKLNYLAVGALFCLAVNSNFFTISVAGLAVIPYLLINRGLLRRTLPGDTVFSLIGFFGIYLTAVSIYYVKVGVWKLHEPTFRLVAAGFSGDFERYRVKPEEWMFSTLYVYFPIFLGICYLLAAYKSRLTSRIAVAIPAYALSVVLFFAWWQFVSHGLMIELPFYFCYLIPALMPLAALVPTMVVATAPARRGDIALLAGTAASLAIPALVSRTAVNLAFTSFAEFCVASGLVVLLFSIAGRRLITRVLAVTTFVIGMKMHFFAQVAGSSDERQTTYALALTDKMPLAVWPASKMEFDLYRISLKFILAMPRFRDDRRKLLFWYTNRFPHSRYFDSIQSTFLWGYSRLNSADRIDPGMPFLGKREIQNLADHGNGSLVLLGYSANDIENGMTALKANSINFRRQWDKQFCSGELCVQVSLIELLPTLASH